MKILSVLGQSKKEITSKDLERKGRALRRKQENLVDALEAQVDSKKDIISTLLAVTAESINENTWNVEYHEAQVELLVLEQELKVARNTFKEFFSDEK